MQMQFAVEKMNGKVKFEFRFDKIDSYGQLRFNYRSDQFDKESPHEDGWFLKGKYNSKKKAITFYKTKVLGRNCNGVSLPLNVVKEIEQMKDELEKKRQDEIQTEKASELKFEVQEATIDPDGLFTKKIFVPTKEHLSVAQREALRQLKRLFGTQAYCLGATQYLKAEKFDVEVGQVHTLSDVETMAEATSYRKEAEDEKEVEQKFKKARNTGKRVEIRRDSVPCNNSRKECDIDIVVRYALPDGSVQIQRTHCY